MPTHPAPLRRCVWLGLCLAAILALPAGCQRQDNAPAPEAATEAQRIVLNQSPPYCRGTKPMPAPWLEPLRRGDLLLPCNEIAALAWFPETRAGKRAAGKRAAIATRADEIRTFFLELRDDLRRNDRDKALDQATQLLPVALARAVLPLWLGTRWDFNGAGDTPGQGEIACGYLVAQALRAVGFEPANKPLENDRRYFPFATLASEAAMKKVLAPASLQRFSRRGVHVVLRALRETGPGVYLVGLDQHFGFLFYDGENPVLFWHGKPYFAVTVERPAAAVFFADSNYRVIGKLDRHAAAMWLDGTRF